MPPTIFLVRHAEAEHNIDKRTFIRDTTLTDHGKEQCLELRTSFPSHDSISLVLSSPLRRAIQTTIIGFGPTLARPNVPYLLIPGAQEISDFACDTGHSKEELQKSIVDLFSQEDVGFDLAKINYDMVEEGWNVKAGYWGPDRTALTKRAADLRAWLFKRPESPILLVTHGAFLHFLTEDWTGDDPTRGTGYHNCEVREFVFTQSSNEDDAHLIETEQSRKRRGAGHADDETVMKEMESVS